MTTERATITLDGSGLMTTLLTVAFVVLKLTHVIAWSWWWVLAPLWLPTLVGVVFLMLCGLVVGMAYLFGGRRR